MAWYDKIVEVGNTAVEFLRNDTVRDIAGVASEFLGDGKADTQSQIALMKAPSLGEYRVNQNLGRSGAGTPKFTDIKESGFQNYAALQAYWKYYLKSVSRMKGTATSGRRVRRA